MKQSKMDDIEIQITQNMLREPTVRIEAWTDLWWDEWKEESGEMPNLEIAVVYETDGSVGDVWEMKIYAEEWDLVREFLENIRHENVR